MRQQTKKRIRLVAVLYLLAVVGLGLAGGLGLVADTLRLAQGTLKRRDLAAADFQLESIRGLELSGGLMSFTSSDPDPQMIYYPEDPVYATGLVIYGRANLPAGEMVLYYTTRPGEAFNEGKKVWAFPNAEGGYSFDLGGRRITGLRLDPDTRGGVRWQDVQITLNPRKAIASYFIPDGREIFLMLFLPGLLAAVCFEVGAILHPIMARRRFRARWQSLEQKDKGPEEDAPEPPEEERI